MSAAGLGCFLESAKRKDQHLGGDLSRDESAPQMRATWMRVLEDVLEP